MTFEESIPIAKQLAENQLKKGFDVDAFLILCATSNMSTGEDIDLVPESNIDEGISYLLKLFVNYHNNSTVDNLGELLKSMRQILSELYHSCKTQDEKDLFKQFIPCLNEIL